MRARLLGSLMILFALAFPALAQERRNPPSLDRVLPQIRRSVPGTFYDAEGPFLSPDGQATYRIKWMTPDGRIIWFSVDGHSGRVLGGAWGGPPSGRVRDIDGRGGWGNNRNNWRQDDDRGNGWNDNSRGNGWGNGGGRNSDDRGNGWNGNGRGGDGRGRDDRGNGWGGRGGDGNRDNSHGGDNNGAWHGGGHSGNGNGGNGNGGNGNGGDRGGGDRHHRSGGR